MNISKRDKILIISAIGVILFGCSIIAYMTPAEEPITPAKENTTIDEMPTPTPTQVPTAEPTTERPAEAHNESNTTIPDMIPVITNCTIDEYNLSVDGEMIRITDEDIHNALMNCSIEDMTFDEFKRHVRDEGIDGQKHL